MKEGYYLSVYIDINEVAHAYQMNLRHDQNMSLWKYKSGQIELVRYWELERLSGFKGHSISFQDKKSAISFINSCLAEYALSLNDIQGIWGCPILDNSFETFWNINDEIADHAFSHLYCTLLANTEIFYSSTILGFAVDGGPDTIIDKSALKKKYYAGCVSINGKADFFSVFSPGLLWDYMKNKFHMREGSLMALASACDSEFKINEIPLLLIDDYKSMCNAYTQLDALWEKINGLTHSNIGDSLNCFDLRYSERENKISMYVKIVQSISLEVMKYNINTILARYKLTSKDCILAVTGGFALNCPTNSFLMLHYGFKDFLSVPCPNDSGQSLGIALRGFHSLSKQKLSFNLQHAYYGGKALLNSRIVDEYAMYIKNISKLNYEIAAEDIMKSPVIWIQGNSEIGPRALGHRSILANPSIIASKHILNDIKQREWWRPVAPIIMEEHAQEWFQMPASKSPFMLLTCKANLYNKNHIPAVLHLDDTARVQTINMENNPELYSVLKSFNDLTNIPLLCNTSLNDKGEPIIETASEAINFALRKNIAIIYIDGCRIELHNHNAYSYKAPLPRHQSAFIQEDMAEIREKCNPYGLSQNALACLQVFGDIRFEDYNLTLERDKKRLEGLAERISRRYKLNFQELIGN